MSDNPFDEPDDDRTVIRPAPGGRVAPPRAASPVEPPREAVHEAAPLSGETQVPPGFEGQPLLAAAQPLLQFMARLRNTMRQPDSGELRERAVGAIRAFEAQAREAGVPMDQLRPAHYALCASLDDIVLNTPWGSQGAWASRSLVSTFHQEVRSGERFFDLLGQTKQNPGTMLPVLELMALCLALGFQGRYRLSPRGPAELDKLREDLHGVIMRQRGAAPDAELSPRWRGVDAPYRPVRAQVPIWVMGLGTLALIGGGWMYASSGVEGSGDALLARASAAPPAAMPAIARAAPVVRPAEPPPPPAPPEPGTLDRLRSFLAPEIREGLVTVDGTEAAPLVRIRNRGMFGSGGATLNPAFRPLLGRIGMALREERGPVLVIGHSDNQPIRTVAFPSNFALSAARAEAAREAIAAALGDVRRISAEGRADTEPVASNATPEGREANRRVEVLLRREGD